MSTPGRVKSSDTVRDRLAASGFTGAIIVTTDIVQGRAWTTVRRGMGALPWTGHVHTWLRTELRRLPGACVSSVTPQWLEVTWDGA